MARSAVKRRKASSPIPVWVLFSCAMFIYLAFHALNGNHGLYAYLKEQHRREMQQIRLAELNGEYEYLESRVAYLSADSLDLDLLDERARAILGYSHPEERIIMMNQQNTE